MRDAEPALAVSNNGRWQPFIALAAFLAAALYHLQTSDAGFRLAAPGNAVAAVARGLLRVPLVYVRTVAATPDAVAIVITGSVLVGAAWWFSLHPRATAKRIVEALAVCFMIAVAAWVLRFGKDDWASSLDHLKDWSYYSTLQQAAQTRQLPLYTRQASVMQTERYFANAETPVSPDAILLAFLDIRTFHLLHSLLVAAIGATGLIALKRDLRFELFGWTIFVVALVLNSSTTWHLAEGNTPWISMWLLPWIFWSIIRLAQGDDRVRTAAITAFCLALMIVNGAWHIFMWSAMMLAIGAAGSRRNIVFLVKTMAMLLALTSFRIIPAVLTVGGGHNEFGAGFAGVGDLIGTLLSERSANQWPWFANTNYFVSWFGFALIAVGLVPQPNESSRADALRVPAVILLVLSIGAVYEHTLFKVPVFVSERFTFRFAAPATLALLLIGCRRIQDWHLWRQRSRLAAVTILAAAISLVVQLTLVTTALRPRFSAVPPAAVDNLKTTIFEPAYVWSVRLGLIIAAIAVIWMIRQMRRTEAVAPYAATLAPLDPQ